MLRAEATPGRSWPLYQGRRTAGGPRIDQDVDVERVLAVPRFVSFVQAASGDVVQTREPYKWNAQMAGAGSAQV